MEPSGEGVEKGFKVLAACGGLQLRRCSGQREEQEQRRTAGRWPCVWGALTITLAGRECLEISKGEEEKA